MHFSIYTNQVVNYHKVTGPRVSSDKASKRTLFNRRKEIESVQFTITGGGDEASRCLLGAELRALDETHRDDVLHTAGIHQPRPPPNLALTLKTEANLTWTEIRQLKR